MNERLEEIKEQHQRGLTLSDTAVSYLIERAEKADRNERLLRDIDTCIRWEDKPIPSILKIVRGS